MQPADLGGIVASGSPALSPDGLTVAYVLQRVDLPGNRYRSQVWLVAADGSSPPRPFTSGADLDASPAWSPDGTRLAFTSRREPERSTLHVAPVIGGGETVTLASQPEAITGLTWSPDGIRLAFASRAREPRYDQPVAAQAPRRITHFFFRLDGTGWTCDRPTHTFVVPADGTAEPVDITPGEHELGQPAWTPDGEHLVVTGATHDSRDIDLTNDVFVVPADASSPPLALTTRTGAYQHPRVSPDGSTIAVVGKDDTQTIPRNAHVAVMASSGGTPQFVSRGLDRTFAPYPGAQAPQWQPDGTLLCACEDRGNAHLYRLGIDGRDPELAVGGARCVTGWDSVAGVVAFTATEPTMPAEVFAVVDGVERRLTHHSDRFAAAAALREPERLVVTTAPGVDVDAWLLMPPDLDPDQRYPMLVNIHGGPFTQYGNRFFDEVQLQARAGYVVLWCNPRGGSGREEAWGRTICGPGTRPDPGTGWGSVDVDDVLAVVDHVVATRPFVEPDRLGVIGGSYGGYLTSWIIGHTNRFAAAVSERAVNNLLSLEWTSDIATSFRTEIGARPREDPELYARLSPITYAEAITTPVLLLHSEDDLRCPIEQAEQLFVALRELGRAVEFVRFPGEGHELSRSGSPVHRRQRAELVLEFFAKHLHP